MNVCVLCVQSQRFPKLSMQLNFWCLAVSGTALEMFQRQALTTHARAATLALNRLCIIVVLIAINLLVCLGLRVLGNSVLQGAQHKGWGTVERK